MKKDTQLQIRLARAKRDAFRLAAEREGRTMTSLVEELVEHTIVQVPQAQQGQGRSR